MNALTLLTKRIGLLVKIPEKKSTRNTLFIIHRGVHVSVLNSKNGLLLSWFFDASVGAQVLAGESYRQAAMRETQEELGFIRKILKKDLRL